jgi:hypothetical protein
MKYKHLIILLKNLLLIPKQHKQMATFLNEFSKFQKIKTEFQYIDYWQCKP